MKIVKPNEFVINTTYLLNIFSTNERDTSIVNKDVRLFAIYLGKKENHMYFHVMPVKKPMTQHDFEILNETDQSNEIIQTDQIQLYQASEFDIFDGDVFTNELALENNWEYLLIFYKFSKPLHDKLKKSINENLSKKFPKDVVDIIDKFQSGGKKTRKRKT